MIHYYARSQLHRSDPCFWNNWVSTDDKESFASQQGKTLKFVHSMYAFVRLCIGVHVTSHVFNLSAVVNVFWGNKIIKSIFNQHSGKGKGFLNTHHFSKDVKLCLFNINKYTEKCFARETVSSYLLKVWKSFIRVNMLSLGLCLFWISVIAKLLWQHTFSNCTCLSKCRW